MPIALGEKLYALNVAGGTDIGFYVRNVKKPGQALLSSESVGGQAMDRTR
jgi:hypothetical protein